MPTDHFHNQKSFRIKADDEKFLSKLVSKESSKSNPSFRVYYGDVSSSVPFTWETRPGTPKHAFSDNSNLPPLTPPPSYYNNVNLSNSTSKGNRSRSKMFLSNLFSRINPRKMSSSHSVRRVIPSHNRSYSSSFSSSSSHSSFSDHHMNMMSTPSYVGRRRRRFASWGSSFDNQVWNSRMCVGIGEDINGEMPVKGGYGSVKKALLSIVGRRST